MAAVCSGGVSLEPVDEVLPDLVGIGVPLGVEPNTEGLLLFVLDVEDLSAELAVDLRQAGLAKDGLAQVVNRITCARGFNHDHFVDHDADLSW